MDSSSRTSAQALTVLTLCFTAYGLLPQSRRSDPNQSFPCLEKSGYGQSVSQCRHGPRTELHPPDCDGLAFLATSRGLSFGDKFLCMFVKD